MIEGEQRVESIALRRLRRDGGTQLRQTMDLRATQEYAEALERGERFPPIVVYDDGENLWLSDGFHRYDAHELREIELIECEVRQGTRKDAILWAAKANRAHGVRLSQADREKTVRTLKDEFPDYSQADMVRETGIPQATISRIWERLGYSVNTHPGGRPRKGESRSPLEHRLSVLPAQAQSVFLPVLTAAGVPEEEAMAAAENLRDMSDERRVHVQELIESSSAAEAQAGIAIMRGLPVTHPLYSRVQSALGHMKHGLPAARGTEFEGAFQIIIEHLEGLLEAIEADERRMENATV